MNLHAFPAIRDDGESVSLTLCQTDVEARRILHNGLRKLFLMTDRKRVLTQVGNVPQIGQIRMLASSIKGLEFTNHLSLLMTDRAYLAEAPLPRSRDTFDKAVWAPGPWPYCLLILRIFMLAKAALQREDDAQECWRHT